MLDLQFPAIRARSRKRVASGGFQPRQVCDHLVGKDRPSSGGFETPGLRGSAGRKEQEREQSHELDNLLLVAKGDPHVKWSPRGTARVVSHGFCENLCELNHIESNNQMTKTNQ